MDYNDISIILGLLFVVILIIFRGVQLKKEIWDKANLLTSLGYCVLSFLSAILISNMGRLAYLTYNNQITEEILKQNKPYVFLAWFLLILAGIVTYISLLKENKKK